MRHAIAGFILAMSNSLAWSSELGVEAAYAVTHHTTDSFDFGAGPERISFFAAPGKSLRLGIEAGYRRGNAFYTLPAQTRVANLGLEAKYLHSVADKHQLGLGISGGRLQYLEPDPSRYGNPDRYGKYYAYSMSYTYLLSPRFTIGMDWRQQFDTVYIAPFDYSCQVNCTGLNHIVYTPYSALYTGHNRVSDQSLSLELGYRF